MKNHSLTPRQRLRAELPRTTIRQAINGLNPNPPPNRVRWTFDRRRPGSTMAIIGAKTL